MSSLLSSNCFTMERFREVLLADDNNNNNNNINIHKNKSNDNNNEDNLENMIHRVLVDVCHDDAADDDDHHISSKNNPHQQNHIPWYERCIPDHTVYHTPLSIPNMILIDWYKLPIPVREQIRIRLLLDHHQRKEKKEQQQKEVDDGKEVEVATDQVDLLQQILLHENNGNDDNDNVNQQPSLLVEIPVAYLIMTSTTTTTTATNNDKDDLFTNKVVMQQQLQQLQRPKGNLSDKLTEYTRGITGQKNRIHLPGGLLASSSLSSPSVILKSSEYHENDMQDLNDPSTNTTGADNNVAAHTSLKKRSSQVAVQVLDLGAMDAYQNGTLLMAPPKMNFTMGITFDDVIVKKPESDTISTNTNDHHHSPVDNNNNNTILPPPISIFSILQKEQSSIDTFSQQSNRIKNTIPLFTRTYFDDDSLFGSSSSSEDDEEDDDDDEEEEDKMEDDDANESIRATTTANATARQSFELSSSGQPSFTIENQQSNSSSNNNILVDEIDQLLTAMTIETNNDIFHNEKNKKKNHDDSNPVENDDNPLEIAQQQLLNQLDTNRKSWATTTLLPLRSSSSSSSTTTTTTTTTTKNTNTKYMDFDQYIPNPALQYPFTLDEFQQQAIIRLERNEAVFVAAHTSAGKTVVAEYAVALALQRGTRCVYTSPIKALSNQKFRDFSIKFGSDKVGLITGDLQINMDHATCLIMTTEILRSMLYRGADIIRDIDCCIFDEIHYVNDSERGVVWEEVIIMLPSYVNLIFLSATTPNTLEFSDWIGRTKRKPVHVIKTNYRPVPLSHHLWAGTKLHKILEGNGPFLEAGYASAVDGLIPQSAKDPNKKKNEQKGRPPTGSTQLTWQSQGTKQHWMSLVRYLDREFLTPTVIFSFSKKKCEEIARMLSSLDLNTAKERSAVTAFTAQATSRLSLNDCKLPQVISVCEMVRRGIGIHHGGLLPILKEMVEILFSNNLIKVLFATETFAMGVNMPAKAVVFNSIHKHDGTQFRVLEPGEYTQMAGRAGRRGLDKIGTVVICCFGECPPPQTMLRQMLTGLSTRLNSQFRLTYNMILNLLKVEEMSVEAMIKRSFSEFATQRALTANEYPQLLAKGIRTLEKLEEQYANDDGSRVGAEDLTEYYGTCTHLLRVTAEVLMYIKENENSVVDDLFPVGKILYVTAARQLGVVCVPAMIVQSFPQQGGMIQKDSSVTKLVCFILLPASYVAEINPLENKKSGTIGYRGLLHQRHYVIEEIELDQIIMISNTKRRNIDAQLVYKPNDKKSNVTDSQFAGFASLASKRDDPFAGMKAFGKKGDDKSNLLSPLAKEGQQLDQVITYLIEAEQAERQARDFVPLDLLSFVRRGNDAMNIRQACEQISYYIDIMRSYQTHRHPNVAKYYATIERKETLRTKVDALNHLLSNESLQLFPDFLQRKAVLRKLGYVTENDTVCVKGRVACEVNSCDELIATEMVFEGLLNELEPEEIAAVLSALVYQEKSSDESMDLELPLQLVNCADKMKMIAINLGLLQKEQGLTIDPGEYCEQSLHFGLIHVVYEWALGVPFKNICDLTDAQEGSIVRCITRLDELCREIRNCARVVGNHTLYRKMEAASTAIKRDIVFASSLYVS